MKSDIPGVDVEHWPVMVVRNTAEEGQDVMRVQFEELSRLYREHPEPYINVVDAVGGKPPTAAQRKMIADFGGEHEPHERRFCKGKAFVFTNPILRGMMTAIQWMRGTKIKTEVFRTVPEAVAWGKRQLAEAEASDSPSF